jgi:HEAT repeat protein
MKLYYLIIITSVFTLGFAAGCKKDASPKKDPKKAERKAHPPKNSPPVAVPTATAKGAKTTAGENAKGQPAKTKANETDPKGKTPPTVASTASAPNTPKAGAEAPAAVPNVAKDPKKPMTQAEKAAEVQRQRKIRRERMQELHKLGASLFPEDYAKLKTVIFGDGPGWERRSAIRALRRTRRDDLVKPLKKLASDKNLQIRVAATLRLYHWGETKFALPLLSRLSTEDGVPLSSAFWTFKNGKRLYDKHALAFLRQAIKNKKRIYVRLDAAVGLIELGKPKEGVPLLKGVLTSNPQMGVRLTTVNYMQRVKTYPAVKKLLELATKDKDDRVSRQARRMLGIPSGTPSKMVKKPKPGDKAAAKDAKPAKKEPEALGPKAAPAAPEKPKAKAAAPASSAPKKTATPKAAAPKKTK